MKIIISFARNITGNINSVEFDPYLSITADGAFSVTSEVRYWNAQGSTKKVISTRNITFNANNSSSMKDHANADEIRPVNISFLPLIAY